jgi:hypothetical protein
MTTFGSKELWMEPMNSFLSSHRAQFKTFLDTICSISSSASPLVPIPPSYSTPLAILTRLPPTSREGFPSLPYLIDHARNFAALVSLWLDHAGNVSGIQDTDGDLLKFHQLVVSLRHRTEDCLASAERAERPSSSLSFKWEELVEQLENTSSHPRSVPHSRMASISTSITPTDDPESPTSGRGLSLDMPKAEASRTRTKSSQQHTSNSSPASNATSPYATSDGQPGDMDTMEGATTPRSAVDDTPTSGYASISAQKVPRTMYGYGYTEGWTQSREALKARERENARQLSQQKQQRRDFSTLGSPMPSSNVPSNDAWPVQMASSPPHEERSWLGDKTSTSGEDDKSSGWSGERAYKSEGEPRNGVVNGRPTRKLDGHERHAALQQKAELMEPGESRDRKPTREPRRDWGVEERQKRAERTEVSGTAISRDGSFIFGSHRHNESQSHPNSTPGSRLQSRQASISSSETDESTTALPRMVKGEMRERDAKDAKDKDKHLFERIGFKKRKG